MARKVSTLTNSDCNCALYPARVGGKERGFCYRHHAWVVQCDHCGMWFHTGRWDTKTCSTKCRVAAHRARAKVKATPLT